jgi:hypothetical protein
MRANQSVFDGVAAGPDVFPAIQILTVEELPPLIRIALTGILIFIRRKRERY